MRFPAPFGIATSFFQTRSGDKSVFPCSNEVVPSRMLIAPPAIFRLALNATVKTALFRSRWTTPAKFAREIPPVSRTGIQYSVKEIACRGSRNAYVSWLRKRPACNSTYALSLSERALRSEEHTSELQSQFHLVC